ncbi:hypothetical protein [Litoreibacter arenae]|uniref:Uncharacterized protein n=1 Tax=Litoreibacter arenae DSM 19593 TaxID=1123360 RepID=S9QHC4_9RHOB|nr:hypothetical protein [Litoreibacter arenae]EPX79237.1 hypothetical protein thalar_02062 [Litoreibacter arenae DSM 19593]
MKRSVLIVAALAACTPAIYEVPSVTERKAAEVANCELVGRVRGVPGVYGPLKELGLNDARRAAKEKASEVGGNTVVFDPVPEDEEVYELRAQVYNC